ncbi:hypothetical protein DYB32_007813 [Aphanomyces invadans]|uniref:Acyltransferase 3 domain-containing protein n=1 Tax=Aphanomyces invadans TaxID=157072 RepID=A0A3R7A550_9STRA|nr:hypothetical protein DYB32_007813 [Aphanomyces invadans]
MESSWKSPFATPADVASPTTAFVQMDEDPIQVVHAAAVIPTASANIQGQGIFAEDDSNDLDKTDAAATKERTHEVKAPSHAISYRPDIDGLRAVAVVPVVLFHAYPHLLPGGFVGVDVFFVISGFLISAILFKEGKKGAFTYANFYSRRIRRIFPALLVVAASTLVVGCCWLLKTPLRTLAATLIASTLFGANLQLLTVNEGYFDASVKENPLLHLWSLGVEEQFYIVWPFLVSVLLRLPLRRAVLAQVAFIVASFVCNVLLLGAGGTNKYAFYFPLSRFWQMAMGGLLAYDVAHAKAVASIVDGKAAGAAALSFSSLALIAIAYAVTDEADAFPGFWALMPTIGAVGIIAAGKDNPLNRHFLGNSVMTFIGNISYSLYLWHWPLLVLAKAHFPNNSTRPWYMEPYAMVVLAVVLSILTLYLVENRTRRHPSPVLVPVLAVCMAILGIMAAVVFKFPTTFSLPAQSLMALPVNGDLNGTTTTTTTVIVNATTNTTTTVTTRVHLNWSKPPRTSDPTVAKILAGIEDWRPLDGYEGYNEPLSEDNMKILNRQGTRLPTIVVLGDSHANQLMPRFKRLLELAVAADPVNGAAKFPVIVFRSANASPPLACNGRHGGDLDLLRDTKPKVVFYSSNWIQFWRAGGGPGTTASLTPRCCVPGYQDSCAYQTLADVQAMANTFQAELAGLVQAGTKVFVAAINPEGPEFSGRNMLNGNNVGAVAPIRRSTFRQTFAPIISILETAVANANATLIDFSDNQCWEDVCQVVSMAEGEPVYKDKDHIRPYYARNYLSTVDVVVEAAIAP